VTKQRAWVGFWILSLVWGASFLFIRIGVEQLSTFQLVFYRTGIAALGLGLVAAWRGKKIPRDWASLRDLLILGVVNTVLPFALITWGEKTIESGLASVLQATAALFAAPVAHFAFPDERLSTKKVLGLALGFLGVIVLASRSGSEEVASVSGHLHLLGQLAVVVASFCYAIGGMHSRRAIQNRLDPIIAAFGAMTVTAVITGIIAYLLPLFGGAAPAPLGSLTPRVVWSILTLGTLNTFVAYLIFYSIIQTLGVSRVSMCTYVIPVVGLILGALVLDEIVDARLLLGSVMIVGSVGMVNLDLKGMLRRQPASPDGSSV
jgi:drug/metabolite transporter (DMT)-like permease